MVAKICNPHLVHKSLMNEGFREPAWTCPLCSFISLEKTSTSISGEYRNKYVSVGVQSPTEINASGRLQECADENVSKADAHSAARTLGAFLKV